MTHVALSTSAALGALLGGPPRAGVAFGRGHVAFGRYVVSLTAPGAPRMPNGLEVDLEAAAGMPAVIGEGVLRLGGQMVRPGPEWDPVPRHLPPAGPAASGEGLLAGVGGGPGLTPAGDDLLAGYVAGLALLHGRRRRAAWLVARARDRTTSLSATLLEHAARGEVPEPVHAFLESGDAAPLLGFGHSSGAAWLEGLLLAGAPAPSD